MRDLVIQVALGAAVTFAALVLIAAVVEAIVP